MTALEVEEVVVIVCDCVKPCWSQAVTAPTLPDAEHLAEAQGWTWHHDRWTCNYCTLNHR